MAESVIAVRFLENIKVLFVGVLIYAIIYALLKKIEFFGDSNGINATIALLAAIIVSFTGAVTYAVSYAINWFIVIFFIVFLLMVLLLFLGVKFSDISGFVSTGKNVKVIVIAFGILFAIVLLKSFFAVNNAYDVNNPQDSPYDVDTSFNTGVDDITNLEVEGNANFFNGLDSDLVSSVLFLLVIGVFVIFLGRN